MTESVAFTAIYEQVEDGWVQARIDELPAVITVAPDADSAREYLLDALREYLLSLSGPPPAHGASAEAPRVELKRESLTIELAT